MEEDRYKKQQLQTSSSIVELNIKNQNSENIQSINSEQSNTNTEPLQERISRDDIENSPSKLVDKPMIKQPNSERRQTEMQLLQ